MDKTQIVDKFLNKALGYLESAEAFAQEQIPAFIEEVLRFKVYEESVDILWGLLFIVVGILVIYITSFRKYGDEKETLIESDEDFVPVSFFFGLLPIIFGILMGITSSLDVVKIKVAPRMYMLEYIKELE